MKGVILAAGRGSRLFPVSAGRPKHALPIAGVPIIARAVRAVREAGVKEVAVVTSPSNEAALREATRDEGPLTFLRQEEPRGTGDAVLAARAFLEGSPALLYLGDRVSRASPSLQGWGERFAPEGGRKAEASCIM